jgi:stage II sporulation protein D (peptidoglycan lytic transglycosylase)
MLDDGHLSSWARKSAVSLGVILLFLSVSSPSRAELIRVALLQQVESLTLASPRGLIITTNGNEEYSNGRSVTIFVGANGSGLIVDGRRLRAERVELRGRNGEIVLNGMTLPGRVIVRRQSNRLLVVNELDIEEYLKGVVPMEMNAAWHLEALKVQAIAARTYAIYQMRQGGKKDFDILASTKDQVYRGRSGAHPNVLRAVEQTRNLILTHGGLPIFAAYSSTAAGTTEDAMYVWSLDLPYLKGVECPFDIDSPHYQWRTDVALPHLERRLREEGFPVGIIASIDPAFFSRSGRVAQVRILHSEGELFLRGEDLRRVVGYTVLSSTMFDLELAGLRIQFTGRGAGHGVGLCQWGAKVLAERGYSAETILDYYYPGTEIRTLTSLPR